MPKAFPRRTLAVAALLLVSPAPLFAQEIKVFAAASLTEAFTALGRSFEQAHPGASVRFNFAGSQVLVTQVEQGAKADVLASADQRWMKNAAEKNLLGTSPQAFARNRLVVVVPKSNPGGIERLQDLARPGLKLVLAGRQVPVGAYSREALGRLSAAPGFPSRYQQLVLANLVSEEENVRAVAAKVQLREADAGIVYQTDVPESVRPQLRILEIPDPYNPIAEYPIAVVRGGNPLGAEFVKLVLSAEGQSALVSRGFLAPTPAGP
jgi:molybdate transport system substrate-binding protein